MKKILLIRFSSIGDIVLTTPVVRALKQQLECELHALTKKQNRGLYENNPYVDQVFFFSESEKEVIPALKKEEYDFVVDLQKNIRSARVRKALGKDSGTFPKYNWEKWLLVNFKINKLPDLHIVDRYFEAVKSLGVTNDRKGLEYFIPEKDVVNPGAEDLILAKGYVAFVLGGQHETKILPPVKVAQVINRLNWPVVLLGGKEDKERGEQVVELTKGKSVFNFCGKYNLNQSASWVMQCKVLVTNDTGLMHVGAAFKKNIITVWGNTVPAFGMYPYLPGEEERAFWSEVSGLKCRPCSKIGYKKCPKKHFKCMMDQDTEKIAEEIRARFI